MYSILYIMVCLVSVCEHECIDGSIHVQAAGCMAVM